LNDVEQILVVAPDLDLPFLVLSGSSAVDPPATYRFRYDRITLSYQLPDHQIAHCLRKRIAYDLWTVTEGVQITLDGKKCADDMVLNPDAAYAVQLDPRLIGIVVQLYPRGCKSSHFTKTFGSILAFDGRSMNSPSGFHHFCQADAMN
jgi:hypothetical protein